MSFVILSSRQNNKRHSRRTLNQIKTQSRSGMGSAILNSLMTISINGPNLELFDLQPAVNHWSSEVHRRPAYRKPSKSKPSAKDVNSDTCLSSDYELSSESDDDDSDNEGIDLPIR